MYGLERERGLRRKPTADRENVGVNRQAPPASGPAQAGLFFLRANIEHDRAAVDPDEMVVPSREAAPRSATYSLRRSFASRALVPAGARA